MDKTVFKNKMLVNCTLNCKLLGSNSISALPKGERSNSRDVNYSTKSINLWFQIKPKYVS